MEPLRRSFQNAERQCSRSEPAGDDDAREDLAGTHAQVLDAVVAIQVGEGNLPLAAGGNQPDPGAQRAEHRRGVAGRVGPAARRRWWRPSRSCPAPSCSSRWSGAIPRSGCSRCSGCPRRGCRRASPCCAGAERRWRPRRGRIPDSGCGRHRCAATRSGFPSIRSPGPPGAASIPRNSSIPIRLTTVPACWWRRFMLGQRSVPPCDQTHTAVAGQAARAASAGSTTLACSATSVSLAHRAVTGTVRAAAVQQVQHFPQAGGRAEIKRW